jgi:hypothetical protein
MVDVDVKPPTAEMLLGRCSESAAGEGITLSEIVAISGRNSFAFAAFLLAMPFLQPVPLGPLTMVCGATFIAIGWQMMRGLTAPALPKSASSLRIHGRFWGGVLAFTAKLMRFCQRFSRERMLGLVSGVRGQRLIGSLILVGGLLLAVPVANLPLNNFFPALMIVFACIGWIERDGLMVFISIAWGVVTVVYFAVVAFLLILFGAQAIKWLSPFTTI